MAFAVATLVVAFGPVGNAAEPAWTTKPFGYTVVDQDVRQVLQEFGRNLSLMVQLEDGVQGRVKKLTSHGTAKAFLEELANEFGLVWYYDGSVLHVSTTQDVGSRLLPLGGVSLTQLTDALDRLGIADRRYALRSSPGADLIVVTGPLSYLSLVEQTVTVLGKVRGQDVRIIRGRGTDGS